MFCIGFTWLHLGFCYIRLDCSSHCISSNMSRENGDIVWIMPRARYAVREGWKGLKVVMKMEMIGFDPWAIRAGQN